MGLDPSPCPRVDRASHTVSFQVGFRVFLMVLVRLHEAP